jgi:hypothetical protein
MFLDRWQAARKQMKNKAPKKGKMMGSLIASPVCMFT